MIIEIVMLWIICLIVLDGHEGINQMRQICGVRQ